MSVNLQTTKIYLVTNCYGDPYKVYIGKTKTNQRYKEHKRKFGNQIVFTYIDEIFSLKFQDWKPLECFWIEYFRQLGFDIQNKNKGGGGPSFHSNKTKEKMSLISKSKPKSQEHRNNMSLAKQNVTQETRDKISRSKLGKKSSPKTKEKMKLQRQNVTQETRDKISRSNKGKIRSQEFREHMSLINKGKIFTEKHKFNLGLCKSKPILQYDLEGNFIREWPSSTEAGRILKIAFTNIQAVCAGKLNTAGKFKWKYKQ